MSTYIPTMRFIPDGYALLGGQPANGADPAISMMWVGFYIVAIGVGLWRFIKFTDARTWIVARPAVVIVLRIAANAIRYVEGSSNNSDMRRIIVEQVLSVLSYFFIADAVLVLLESMLAPSSWFLSSRNGYKKTNLYGWILGFLHIVLVPAVILCAWAAGKLWSITTPGNTDEDRDVPLVGRCRLAGAALFLSCASVFFAYGIQAAILKPLKKWSKAFIVFITALSVMPPAYMVAIYRQIDASSLNSDGSKTAFYCVWELPIFLIVLLLLTLHLPRMFLLGEVGEQRRGEQEGAKDRWTELEGGASPSTTRGSEARV